MNAFTIVLLSTIVVLLGVIFTVNRRQVTSVAATAITEQSVSVSERIMALMSSAKHPMTAGMVMRRLYPLGDRNYFLFQLVKSNLQSLNRDGSVTSWRSGRGNSVYQVCA